MDIHGVTSFLALRFWAPRRDRLEKASLRKVTLLDLDFALEFYSTEVSVLMSRSAS
jgi:hypothetical protein